MKPTLVPSLVLAALVTAIPARAEPPVDPWFAQDKAKHFAVSAALAASGYGLSAITIEGRTNRIVLGATFALGAGYAKEVVDAVGFGTPSWKDFVWDVIGTAAGIGFAVTLDAAFSPSPASPSRAGSPSR